MGHRPFEPDPDNAGVGMNMSKIASNTKLKNQNLFPSTIAATAVFTALVCMSTMVFSVYIPSTEGFFNIGESMVFLSALLFGPYIGAFAGGVGSALADLILPYYYYAPGTLVVKACEGFVVGMLRKNAPRFSSKSHWQLFTLLFGLIAGCLLAGIGAARYSGETEVTLGLDFFGTSSLTLHIPAEMWIVLGSLVFLSVTAVGFVVEPGFGWTLFSVIVGGLVMVLGYFIYQMFFIGPLFNIEVVALGEIPVNIGQMIVGGVVALPVAKAIWRAFPHLRERQEQVSLD